MKKSGSPSEEAENILIALDQISQTIDVLSSTVNRLKYCVTRSSDKTPGSSQEKADDPTWIACYSEATHNGHTH